MSNYGERTSPHRANIEPESIELAVKDMMYIRAEIMDIQAQIISRNANNEELPNPDYYKWKAKAVSALKYKEARHAYLKRWIQDHQPQTQPRTKYSALIADVIDVLVNGKDTDALQRLLDWRANYEAQDIGENK